MAEPKEVFDSLDDICVDFETIEGVMVCKQIGKAVLAKGGSWALMLFTVDATEKGVTQRKVMIQRYRSIGGGWRKIVGIRMKPDELIDAANLIS